MSFSEFVKHIDDEIEWLKAQYLRAANGNQELLAGNILDTIKCYYEILKEVSKL